MRRRMPPLGALRAFEAAMRHGGLEGAAGELAVTVSAISHQIRALEADLGAKLTRRIGRRLSPTTMGEALLPGLREGFARITEAVAELTEADAVGPLTVNMRQTFALHWFAMRQPRFERAHPQIPLRLLLSSRPIDFAREEVDLAVYYGAGDWPGLRADLLFADPLVPVCSPMLLSGEPGLRCPSDLARHTLLVSVDRQQAWPDWLQLAGVAVGSPLRTQVFETTNLALQAAARSLGVALVGRRLARSLVDARWLALPFEIALPDPFAYFLVCPRAWAERPRIRALRSWLIEEVQAEGPI
jgi:LysR family transcriptional regulator, glycine cleavage system transcriptional activator